MERGDPPPEHRDRVERRIVGPVHVLEHEHRGVRQPLELGDEQRVHLMRRPAGGERLLEGGRDEIPERAERARDREVVARPEHDPRSRLEIAHEAA